MTAHEVSAEEMCNDWILDGEASLDVLGAREVQVTATAPMALWCPTVFGGHVEVEFDCLVAERGTKLLVLAHGHGADDTPIREWERDGSYDNYNADRTEVYTIAFNRGLHIADQPGDQLANVRRIGGPDFAIYTAANFRERGKEGREFWEEWNARSLVGAALEPDSGVGKYLRHRVTIDPPRICLAVGGVAFAELIDHRQPPLTKGSIAFRCMTRGKTFSLRDVVIRGKEASSCPYEDWSE